MKSVIAASVFGTIMMLSGCVTGPNGEAMTSVGVSSHQLALTKIRVQSPERHGSNTISFNPAGKMQVKIDGTPLKVNGSWDVAGTSVCTKLTGRGRECWPIDMSAADGAVAMMTSDRGQTVKVTYLEHSVTVAEAMRSAGAAQVASAEPARNPRTAFGAR